MLPGARRFSLAPSDDPAGVVDDAGSNAIALAQLALLKGLLRRLVELSRMRTEPGRLAQLCGDIEAVSRRNGWKTSADLAGPLRLLLTERCGTPHRELLDTILPLVELAAVRPDEDWLAVVTTTRIAVGIVVERQTKA